ncbi:MAG: hypothetical protein ACOYY3_02040 [Chloroflexota bacterium]
MDIFTMLFNLFSSMLFPGMYFDSDAGGGGGTGGEGDPPADAEDKGGKGGQGEATVSMSQERFDKVMADRAKQAARSRDQELAEKAGFKSVDEMLEAAKTKRQQDEDEQSDLEKAQGQVTTLTGQVSQAQSERDAANTRAQTVAMKWAVRSEAQAAGFRSEALDDLWTLVQGDASLFEQLEVNGNGDVSGAAEVVKTVAQKRAFWLEEQKESHGTPPRGRRRDNSEDGQKKRTRTITHL